MDKFKEFLISNTGKAVMTVVFVILDFSIMMWALKSNITAAIFITLIVCAVFGWKALNRITPAMFLWLSFTGWIIYFFIKGVLSMFIGAFVAPFQIAKMIANAVSESMVD